MSRRAAVAVSAAAIALVGAARMGRAGPYRLRADAFATAQSPVGLLVLQADGSHRRWLHAEALVWVGAGDQADSDALVVALRLGDPAGRIHGRLGRFVLASGALRPVHIDGGDVTLRLPWKTGLELFGGMPVVPEFGARSYDWLVGMRASRQLGRYGSAGVALLQRRDGGELSEEEIGIDAGGAVKSWLDVAGRAAYDLIDPGLAELRLSASAHRKGWHVTAFATDLSPSRLLPATSLFSVLGDVPSRKLGATAWKRIAPRLDASVTTAARAIGDNIGLEAIARAVLRLDDAGRGALTAEAERENAPDGSFTGLHLACRLPLAENLITSTELELAFPDHPDGRGAVWPWGILSLSWSPVPGWRAAAAIEASASPENTSRVDALFRLTRAWRSP